MAYSSDELYISKQVPTGMDSIFTDVSGISVKGKIRSSTQGLMTGTVSEMPDASTSKDIAVLYVGPDGDYIHGSYYLSDGESWQKLNIDIGLEVDPAPIQDSSNPVASGGVYGELANKVNVEEGKDLSSNDFTDAEKTKLAGIAQGAQANVIEKVSVNGSSLTPSNKIVNIDLSDYTTKDQAVSSLSSSGSTITYRKADGTSGSVTMSVDPALSTSSANPIQNRVVANALATKLDSTGTAVKAVSDANGNNIANTYATKVALNDKQDKLVAGQNIIINGNTISATGGGSGESVSITIDSALSSTSENPVQNKIVTNMMANLGIIDTDAVPNTIQYTKLKEFAGEYVAAPNSVTLVSSVDASISGNTLTIGVNGVTDSVNLPTTSSSGGSVTVDSEMSPSSTNPVQNKVIGTWFENEGILGISEVDPNVLNYTKTTPFNGMYVHKPLGVTLVSSVDASVSGNTLTIGVNGVEGSADLSAFSNDWTSPTTKPSFSTLFSYSSSMITAVKEISFVIKAGSNHCFLNIPKGTCVYHNHTNDTRFTTCILDDSTVSNTYKVQVVVVKVNQTSYTVRYGDPDTSMDSMNYLAPGKSGTGYHVMYR